MTERLSDILEKNRGMKVGDSLANQLFDEMAKRYDSADRIFLANIIQEEVQKELEEMQNKVLLDYGSATGLVSLGLAHLVKEVHLIDKSEEMIAIANQKIESNRFSNVQASCHDLMDADLTIKADIILVSLVLLHIPDTANILKKLFHQLNPKGKLIIVDFDLNEKIKDSRVHNGFDKQLLKEKLKLAGFTHLSSDTFFQGEKLFMGQDASLCLTLGYK